MSIKTLDEIQKFACSLTDNARGHFNVRKFHILWSGNLIGIGNLEDHNGFGALHPKFWRLERRLLLAFSLPSIYVQGMLFNSIEVWDHHPTGDVLEVDLSLHGSIRSAGTREYRWLMLSSWQRTDRFGDKSQRRDATADRSAPRWWVWDHGLMTRLVSDRSWSCSFGPSLILVVLLLSLLRNYSPCQQISWRMLIRRTWSTKWCFPGTILVLRSLSW